MPPTTRRSAQPPGPLEKIRELITFTVEGDRSFHDAWGFWIELYVAARKEPSIARKLNDALEEWRRIFTEVLNEAIDGGHVTPAYDPDDLTRLLLAVVDGLAMQTINGSYGSDPAQMTSLLFRFAAGELNIPVREIEQAGDR